MSFEPRLGARSEVEARAVLIGHQIASAETRRGRLAEVLAVRGGRAEPEVPFVIKDREALIYRLCQAAELDHGIMCQYLFAAFSLRQRGTRDELGTVRHASG